MRKRNLPKIASLLLSLALALNLPFAGSVYAEAGPDPEISAPVIDSSYSPEFPAIQEDTLGDDGVLISDLTGETITTSTGSVGIAVYGMTGEGSWEAYYNNTWWNMEPLAPETASMLKSDMKLRFVPAADWHGTATISYRAWDVRNDGPANDEGRLKYDITENGGVTPYSAEAQTASIVVEPVNDIPRVIFPQTPKLLNFNGSTDFVTVNNLSLKNEMTFEAWVYNNNPYATWSRLFDFGNGSPGQNIMVGFKGNSGQMFLHNYSMDNNSIELLVNEQFPVSQWVHVEVMIDDDGIGSIYWDGVLKASGYVGPITDVYRAINYVGRSHWGQDAYFNGKIRDIRFWNYARTPQDIAADKDNILTGNESGLIGYMPMLESEGTYLNDLTGKDISGNIIEADWVEDKDAPLAVTIKENTDTAELLYGIYTTDPDAEDTPGGQITLKISVPQGAVHVNTGLSDVAVIAGANDSATMTLRGSKSAVDIALGTLVYTPVLNFFGTVKVTFDADDEGNTGSGGALQSTRSLYVVVLPNSPVISPIPDQVIMVNEATDAVPFTLSGGIVPASQMTVTYSSSNTALLPLAGITLGGEGANRTVQLTPAEGQSGYATVTITVSDGRTSSSTTFNLVVLEEGDDMLEGWIEYDQEEPVFIPGDPLTLSAYSTLHAAKVTATIGDQVYELVQTNPKSYISNGYKEWALDIEMPFVKSGEQYVIYTAYTSKGIELSPEPEGWLEDNYFMLYTPATELDAAVSDIGYTTANVTAEIGSDGGKEITERGIIYGTSSELSLISGTVVTNEGTGVEAFNTALTGLTPDTVYYVRSYAINEAGTAYSKVTEFRTKALPTIAKDVVAAVAGITTTTAAVNTTIGSDGGTPVIERGIIYGTTAELNVNSGIVIADQTGGTDPFATPLTNLTPDSFYFARSYVITETGIAYSTVVQFRTLAVPTVATDVAAAVANVGTSSASVNTTIGTDGGTAVLERGIIYSTSAEITKENGTVVKNSELGTSPFTTALTGLSSNTVYYVRSYVITEIGIAYSPVVQFRTSAVSSSGGSSGSTAVTTTPAATVSVSLGSNAGAAAVTKLIGGNLPVSGQLYSADGKALSGELAVNADGSIALGSLAAGEYLLALTVTAPNGVKLAGQLAKVIVDSSGNATITSELIDPYGIITDKVTGKAVKDVKVTLYWSDTELNRSKGRVPGTAVDLPGLPDFAPNQNVNPQISTLLGEYGWMVPADGDYYIIGEHDHYVTYDSRQDTRSETFGLDSYIKGGIIHVGKTIVPYSFSIEPKLLSSGEHTPYLKGYPDGTFKPERGLSRAELAVILSRVITDRGAAGTAAEFTDIQPKYWAAGEVAVAAQQGWMKGYTGGTFAPERQVTRAELAQALYNIAKWSSNASSSYSDVKDSWAYTAISAAEAAGLLTGYPDGTFKPDKAVSRAEAVTVFNRFLNRQPWEIPVAPVWSDVPASYWGYTDIMEASVKHSYKLYATGTEIWD